MNVIHFDIYIYRIWFNNFDGSFQFNMVFMYLVILLETWDLREKWQVAFNSGYKVEQGHLFSWPWGIEHAHTYVS